MELEFVFKKFLSLGVHKKDSQWLAVNKFLSNSKTYLRFFYLHFLFLRFLYHTFFLLMKILNTSARRKIHSIKLSESSNQKVFLSICWKNNLGMNAGLWSSVCVWFWSFENFCEDFWDVWVLRNYFYKSFELSKFWCKVFTNIIRCLRL